jgi:hypothetical protein
LPSRKTLLVLHLAGQYPLAGVGWQALHYIVGLARLGHDVYYVEDSGAPPYDPRVKSVVEDSTHNVEALARMMSRFGFADHWAYHDLSAGVCHGLSRERLSALYAEADALVNLCGATRLREEHLRCPVRIYLETDPVFEQVKLAEGNPRTLAFLEAHTHHFTYGENLGTPDCPIPLPKFAWKRTRPPVVLDLWESRVRPEAAAFTTVATWRNVGKDVEFAGERYTWSKHVNFLRFEDLPRRTRQPFELALETGDPAVAARLRERGWRLVDPDQVSHDIDAYREYVHRSRGEFTVVKDIYARTGSGWFSDRSVCYLAAGKPVISQATGFERLVPTGRGLFAFSTLEEILAAVDAVNADYADHCRSARRVAEESFASDSVLREVLRQADLA